MNSLGSILEIDLTLQSYCFYPFPENLLKTYICGRGFNVAYLNEKLPVNVDPLGPENKLMFSSGLLTNKRAPVSPRLHVSARSPLTNILGSSNIGGNAGMMLTAIGIQTIIVKGKAEKPTYVMVDGESVEFKNAENLWGCDTWNTEDWLKEQYQDREVGVLAIGPAGENLTRFAAIISEKDHAAGRTGMGAVMGSKNLKAVVVDCNTRQMKRQDKLQGDTIKRYIKALRESSEFRKFAEYGGAGYVKWADDLGILATRNYRQNRFEHINEIDGKSLKQYRVKKKGCPNCPIKCKADLKFEESTNETATRPEFETMVNLGSKCGLSNLKELVNLDNLCTRLGLDTISTGNAISFAMDLYQRGILSATDAGGLDLDWGNAETMKTLVEDLAYHRNLGKLLAQGVKRAAEEIGRGSEQFAPHVKGLELAAYHPYNIMGTALGYAVSSRGGDYSSVYASMEYTWTPEKADLEFGTEQAVNLGSIYGKPSLIKRAMIVNVVLDSLGICKVPVLSLLGKFDLKLETELVNTLTGLSFSSEELFEIGERIIHTERYLNYKFGSRAIEDRLPNMFFMEEYISSGRPSEALEWMEPMKMEFYREMGWESDGCPSEKKLLEMGINISECPDQPAA
ncbi:MAG: aldehyde ferredoxin oxidoreductase family protein [Proteobacteria bacterium]|nr:aldehyde ferredoxin oxidoreductase family protein [Pseudomonadota bacterium]